MYGQKMEVEKWDQQYTPTYIGYCTYGQKMEVEKWDQHSKTQVVGCPTIHKV